MAGQTSPEFGPTLIAALPDTKKEGVRKRELVDAMSRLLATDRIHVGKTNQTLKGKKCLLPGRREGG